MVEVEAQEIKSQDMDCDHPSQILNNAEIIENINEKNALQVVEHLSTVGDLENHTLVNNDISEAKKKNIREKRKRYKARKREKKELSKNSSSLDNGISPSTQEIQESSTNNSSLEPSDQAPATALIEKLKEVVDNKSDIKERKSNKRKLQKLKRKLASDASLPSTADIQENLEKDFHLDVSNLVSESAYTKELMGQVKPVNDPSVIIKENDLHSVGEKGNKREGQAQVDNNSEAKETKSKKKKPRKKKRKLSSDSSLHSTAAVQDNPAKDFPLEVSNQITESEYPEELMGKVISVNNPSVIIKENDSYPVGEKENKIEGHAQVDNNSKEKETETETETKRRKPRNKKRKLSSDSSVPSTADIQGNSNKDASLEVSNQVPGTAYTEKITGQVESIVKENNSYPVGESAVGDKEKENKTETVEKNIESSISNTDNISEKDFNLEVLNQVPESAYTEELMGQVISVNDPSVITKENDLYPSGEKENKVEGLTAVDNISEAKETKTKTEKRKSRNKKRKLLSDSSLPSATDIQGTTDKAVSLEVPNQGPEFEITEKRTGQIESIIKENNSYPVGQPAVGDKDKENKTESVEKNIESGIFNTENISEKDFPLEVSNQVPESAYSEEPMGQVISVNDPSFITEENDSYPVGENGNKVEGLAQVDNRSEAKETKIKKRKPRNKKRKLLSDSSLPSATDIQGTSDKAISLEVPNQGPESENTENRMGQVESILKENNSYPVGETAVCDKKKENKTEIVEKNVESGILIIENISENGVTVSSELSESTGGDDVSQPEIGNEVTQPAPMEADSGKLRKKLLVLDINGILTDIVACVSEEHKPDMILSRKAVFKRPFCDDFLRFCFENFDVGIWSSRTMKNVKSAVDFLMGELQTKLLFCWDQSHCTDTGFNTLENREKPMLLKELKKLWEKHDPSLPWEKGVYNESNTILLDDSPYKALRNPPYTAIFPAPYCYKNVKDNSLGPGGDLRVYLEGLASADNVQKYVEENPFGQRAITNANASWNFYRKVIHDTSLPTRKTSNYQRTSTLTQRS